MKKKKHGMTGKRNAAKPPSERGRSRNVRLTDADYARWGALADAAGLTRPGLLREWISRPPAAR